MRIGGLQKSTLIDYPGKVAATIFVSGCNFRCPFCHNPELVLPGRIQENKELPLKEVFSFLEERKGFLEGVVLCGGEPTVYPDLEDFVRGIKEMGFSVKLDTNGYEPTVLGKLIGKDLFDYVAMDVKAPKEKYSEAAGVEVDLGKIEQSIGLVKSKAKDYEFRTTLAPGLVEADDVLEIAQWIGPAKKYFLQNFSNAGETIDKRFTAKKPFSDRYLEDIKKQIESFFDVCGVR